MRTATGYKSLRSTQASRRLIQVSPWTGCDKASTTSGPSEAVHSDPIYSLAFGSPSIEIRTGVRQGVKVITDPLYAFDATALPECGQNQRSIDDNYLGALNSAWNIVNPFVKTRPRLVQSLFCFRYGTCCDPSERWALPVW